VYGLGNDSDGGSDGDNRSEEYYSIPRLITALLGERVRAIAAGRLLSCAVTDAGAVYTWGSGENGNLCHGDVRNWDRPTLVQGLQGIHVVGMSFYATHTLALAANGSVYAFGKGLGLDFSQEAGDGEEVDETAPQRIQTLFAGCRGGRREAL
jgi:alpha-tubulin suppressor-like RCC1 family protein